MIKIYDCSNSIERPSHWIISQCPKENSIVSDLKKYTRLFNAKWVCNINKADVLFTNDVFPQKYHSLNIRKIKRMDGIFQLKNLLDRNILLNQSAQIADMVIFISEYSKKSYMTLYGNNLKASTVILNSVDDNYFYRYSQKYDDIIFAANCSNWSRPEKRFQDILYVFNKFKNIKCNLIGNCSYSVPKNIIKHGYLSTQTEINKILNQSSAFINLSYKDACPKVISQAVACKLPILYANSGGVPEQIIAGTPIKDNNKISIDYNIPNLNKEFLNKTMETFVNNFKILQKQSQKYQKIHIQTLTSYYKTIKNIT